MAKLTRPVLALILLVGVPLFPADAQVFEPESFTLDNGLEVVVVHNDRAPIVTHMIWYKVGSADEPRGKSGIAHFLEHLMFKGTSNLAPGEFSKIVARHGGRENAFTSQDYTGYYQTVAKDRLALMMQHEADRMVNLVLTDEVVLPEREVILEERRSRVDNEPAARLGEMAEASLYLHHPYGRPVIGWENEIRDLGTHDALAFYRTWYAPNNAVLVISGDVTATEVRSMAEATYGAIPARPVPERQRVEEPQQWAPRRVELESEQVGQPSLSIRYLAPSYGSEADGEAYALEVLSEILNGATGRLHRSLAVEQALAASAGSGYDPQAVDLASFVLYVSPRPGVELARLERALEEEIAKLVEAPLTEEEVERAKQRLIDAAVFARDDVSTAAQVLGRAIATGRSVEEVEDWPNRIRAVTKAQVEAAARSLFDERNSVTAVLRAKPTA